MVIFYHQQVASAPLPLKRWVLYGIALIILVRLVLLLHHFYVDLDGFFLARGDDVIRIKSAALWSRLPRFWPDAAWLPLPSYLLGAAFWIDPDPFTAPAVLHLAMSTAVYVIGLCT
jgi:hypothetical protein